MFKNPSQEFTYIRTYSKWIEEASRRENWEETVTRYVNFLRSELSEKIPEKVYNKIDRGIKDFDVMPSMRALWSAGKAAKFDNTAMYNCSFSVIDSTQAFAESLYILMCGTGYGFSVENKYIGNLPSIPKLTSAGKGTITILDSKEGWADSIKQLMDSLYEGKDIEFDYSLLRPKGARLLTMGGRSSGPAPLITLHNYIREVFGNAQGRQLTSLECHDICNQIAESVVVGGVRRSSEISLSDLHDEEMRNAKIWPFPLRRSMANNSAVYHEKPTAVDFLKEWSALASSGTGERGIFNLETARNKSPERRDKSLILGTNPCVTGNTEILTKDGYQRIDSLVDQSIEIWNGFEWSKVTPKITGTNQKLVTVNLSNGMSLTCTPYHKFITALGYTGKTEQIEALNLQPGMKLIKHEYPIIEHGPELKNAYTNGFISAEGMELDTTLYVYKPKEICLNRLEGIKSQKWEENNKRHRITLKETPMSKKFVPIQYNLKSKLEWLAGLFDGDGCELIEGGLQLVSIDKSFLLNVQKLLTTVGIQSKVLFRRKAGYRKLPDHQGDKKDYWCQDTYMIGIGAIQMQKLKKLGLHCERLSFEKEPQRDASQFVTIVDVVDAGEADYVYCFNEPKRHMGIFDGILTGQCSEILLRDKQFCNLSEVIIRKNDDLDSLLEKVETATWIGAIQSTFTYFPYLSKQWKKNCEEERLLGVSLTGQMDNPEILTPDCLKALKSRAIKTAKKAAEHLQINIPSAITCVKPSGTVSQLVDSSSGIHTRYAQYYIRRYRIASIDPLFKMLKSQGAIFTPENGQEKRKESEVDTWVISFPIKAPLGCMTRHDMTAIEQLEWYKKIQTYWCEHNASMTVFVDDKEWIEVGNWVFQNWEIINGVSFLPKDNGKYQQAPYEEINKEQYDKLLSKLPKIDYSKLGEFEKEDNTEGAKSLACTGDRCEIT